MVTFLKGTYGKQHLDLSSPISSSIHNKEINTGAKTYKQGPKDCAGAIEAGTHIIDITN